MREVTCVESLTGRDSEVGGAQSAPALSGFGVLGTLVMLCGVVEFHFCFRTRNVSKRS